MKVKPAIPGSVVRYPLPPYRRLPDEGDDVNNDLYWQRRLIFRDVVLVEETGGQPTGREPLVPMTTR